MIVTQDDALADAAPRLRVHGGAKTYYHDEVGYNSRLDALQAAVLLREAAAPRAWSASAATNAAYYNAAFADSRQSRLRSSIRTTRRSSISTRIRAERRDELQAHLNERGNRQLDLLSASAASSAVFRLPRLQGRALPEAERAAQEVISLPDLSRADVGATR